MLMVVIALLPATFFGVYNFGLPALIMMVSTTAASVLTEFIYEKLMHKKVTVGDFSAVVTGMLPTTGITLPFISYGGTAILFLMAEMGVALGISRRIRLEG